MNKTKILDINGKTKSEIAMPSFFSAPVREDLIFKVLETKKKKQPYAPSPVAGKQHAAAGKLVHRRHVWRSGYGTGSSRIPRKMMSRKGSRFVWMGAEIPSTVGGRRAHPPKVLSMINTKKINKKEEQMALISALSATAQGKEIIKKYSTLEGKKIENVPFVVESKITTLKTKELLSSLKKILGDLYEIAIPKKAVRAGKGKLRGRKYKKSAGILIVTGKDEKIKTRTLDVINSVQVGVIDLAEFVLKFSRTHL